MQRRSQSPNRRTADWLITAFILIPLFACSVLTRDPQADSQAHSFFAELSRHETDAFTNRLDPILHNPNSAAQLADLERLIPASEPRTRIKVTTVITVSSKSGTVVLTTDEYDYSDRAALVQTRLFKQPGTQEWLVQGFQVQVATFEQLKTNNFVLAGKPATQYLFLLIFAASPVLIIAALITVLRTSGLRRKWLWCIAAFLGVSSIRMNWTTGVTGLDPISVHLLGASFTRGLSSFSPWILTASVPIGALLILAGIWANPQKAKSATPSKQSNLPNQGAGITDNDS